MYETYRSEVEFFVVYIKEAHPSDGWFMPSNEAQGIDVATPTTKEERIEIAGQACSALRLTMPCLVDDIDDSVDKAYEAAPDRLYVIDKQGKIAVQGGPGPFGFPASVSEAEKWLKANTAVTTLSS